MRRDGTLICYPDWISHHGGPAQQSSRGGARLMRRMSMFWGCTMPVRFPFGEEPAVAPRALGVESVDLGSFVWCPETGAFWARGSWIA